MRWGVSPSLTAVYYLALVLYRYSILVTLDPYYNISLPEPCHCITLLLVLLQHFNFCDILVSSMAIQTFVKQEMVNKNGVRVDTETESPIWCSFYNSQFNFVLLQFTKLLIQKKISISLIFSFLKFGKIYQKKQIHTIVKLKRKIWNVKWKY